MIGLRALLDCLARRRHAPVSAARTRRVHGGGTLLVSDAGWYHHVALTPWELASQRETRRKVVAHVLAFRKLDTRTLGRG